MALKLRGDVRTREAQINGKIAPMAGWSRDQAKAPLSAFNFDDGRNYHCGGGLVAYGHGQILMSLIWAAMNIGH